MLKKLKYQTFIYLFINSKYYIPYLQFSQQLKREMIRKQQFFFPFFSWYSNFFALFIYLHDINFFLIENVWKKKVKKEILLIY